MNTQYPLWAEVAFRELLSDVHEIEGPQHSLRVLEYHQATSLGASDDSVPWCSSAMNWIMRMVGIKGTHNAMARSWMRWGKPLKTPRPGCITVFWRGKQDDGVRGHVALYLRRSGMVLTVLGGNQNNRWTCQGYPQENLLGYRWPLESDRFL